MNPRSLPSVDRVLSELSDLPVPRTLLRDLTRSVIDRHRRSERTESADIAREVRAEIARLLSPSLTPVINATGVVLHTNLGRAPLANFQPIAGYSNLEYDLQTGRRGKRDVHTAELLRALLGRPAILVNNNAAAVFLILHELAAGGEVIVSRGELIEIGDGFRIPEIMARSGAIIREVGTTNRTRASDYANAISDKTRLILRVHPSNFAVSGFTERPDLRELCALARERSIPLYEDLGSGCLVDLRAQGIAEPLVRDSLDAGVGLVSFSCDKLLGGPQTGIIAGDEHLVQRVRRNSMYRALRVDKLIIEQLETTLRQLLLEQWDAIPALRMIREPEGNLQRRAEALAEAFKPLHAVALRGESPIGGGSTPGQALATWAVHIAVSSASKFEKALRAGSPPVICRIHDEAILLDVRTILPEQDSVLPDLIAAAAKAASVSS